MTNHSVIYVDMVYHTWDCLLCRIIFEKIFPHVPLTFLSRTLIKPAATLFPPQAWNKLKDIEENINTFVSLLMFFSFIFYGLFFFRYIVRKVRKLLWIPSIGAKECAHHLLNEKKIFKNVIITNYLMLPFCRCVV